MFAITDALVESLTGIVHGLAWRWVGVGMFGVALLWVKAQYHLAGVS